jgi:signal transduction histidine kinase/Na+/proline symporter
MLAPAALVALTVGYLGALFAIAALVDRGTGLRLARSPAATALALGVFATSWTLFGSVGFAATDGWRFLAIYVGATLSCALVPVVWAPLARVVRERQLPTLADVFAYRYQGRALGALVTLFLLLGSLPYQALQLRAAVEVVAELGGGAARGPIALVITGLLVLFGVMYGVRHLSPRERHDGLVAAVAVESIVKAVALVSVGAFACWGVLGGPAGLSSWLARHPQALEQMTRPAREPSWLALLVTSAAAVFLLPRQWHMGFTEGDERGLRAASWALPAYLLLLNLPVPLVLWAGQALELPGRPDFYALGLVRASGSPLLAAAVFLGALSAAGAMILVTTVALAGMVQNHLLVPLVGLPAGAGSGELLPRLRWIRRALVAGIILAGHGVYLVAAEQPRLVDLGLSSFVGVAQLLPGVIGVLLWPRATARGVTWGLLAGTVLWLATAVVPLITGLELDVGVDFWTFATAASLGTNTLAFVAGSLAREPRAAEREAAEVCRRGSTLLPPAAADADAPADFAARLAPVLGERTAAAEVARALADLELGPDERRPDRLRALRDRLEQNLSGLVGPVTARAIVDEQLAVDPTLGSLLSEQLRHAEAQVAAARLEGPARALELARRFLRQVLEELPVGVGVIGPAGDVALWNDAMARTTGAVAGEVLGRRLADLPEPWGEALGAFAAGSADGGERTLGARQLSLRRAALEGGEPGALVLLVEDRTEQRALEARVAHQERLASLGRLAAGVAHEIGNPLTGIASLAQNLLVEAADADVGERLGLIVDQTERIDRIVRALTGFSRAGGPARAIPGEVPLAEVVAEAITLARLGRAGRAADLVARVPPSLRVMGDRQRLEQVFVNLLTNACDASPPGARIEVSAERAEERVVLRVADAGAGMTPDVRARIFEPFFTTKEVGEGTGLGLALVYSIVSEHGGTIDVESTPGLGTTVTVSLPGVVT